jgi:aminoglycoside phosphotransferase (APT) family kinase protein
MSGGTVWSKRLGPISDAQFATATERLGVGKFVRAAPVTSGLFGQNVFVTTSEGEFVLRGAPHYVSATPLSSAPPYVRNDLWQFTKEVFFARQLHERTKAPVPWPQLLDKTTDIFGWPYIVMPRMPGTCFEDSTIGQLISEDEQLAIANALGRALAILQTVDWPFAGEFDTSITLVPYPLGHMAHVARETRIFAGSARTNGRFTKEDDVWTEQIFSDALSIGNPAPARPNVYVHGDYKLNNLCLMGTGNDWKVSGVFDLHGSHFGDGASDLCRQACSYLDRGGPDIARAFVSSYRKENGPDPTLVDRMPAYLLNERVKIWEYFTRPDVDAAFFKDHTFRSWTEPYIERLLALL